MEMKNISIIILAVLSILCVSAAGTSFEQREWKKAVTESQIVAMGNFNDAVNFCNDHNLGMASLYLGTASFDFKCAQSNCGLLPGAVPNDTVEAAREALRKGQAGVEKFRDILRSESETEIKRAIEDVRKADKDFWRTMGSV
jgi:hypothetical protein